MISPRDAQELILRHTLSLGSEKVPLLEALHRFLAHPVVAPIDLPPFSNSAMDGFALRSEETCSASEKNRLSFKVIRTVAAGDNPGEIGKGEAARIMTGAPLPDGADAVVPFEEVVDQKDRCLISHPLSSGENVRWSGEDVRKGEPLLTGGEKVTSRTIALLAALGVSRLEVFKKPRVKILSTGSELVEGGAEQVAPLPVGQIYNSNGPALLAALREMGIEGEVMEVVADKEEELKKVLASLPLTDVLITVGGVSAGDFDLIPKVLKEGGATILFHKVAIKPGKPLLYAIRNSLHIFALPGNPVSALMVFDRFVRPALLKMMGSKEIFRVRRIAKVASELKGTPDKEDYLRGIVAYQDGHYVARSAGSQGSARLVPLAQANAVLILPPSKEILLAGEWVEFEFLSEDL